MRKGNIFFGLVKEDKIFLNLLWLYKSNCISGRQFIKWVNRFPHSFENIRISTLFEFFNKSFEKV